MGWKIFLTLLGTVGLFQTASAQNIPKDNLEMWLSADKEVTREGDLVPLWGDQSGNDAYAEQGEPEFQPTFSSNAANGKPAIVFDGIDDFMTFYLFNTLNGLTQMTIAIVCANTENSATGGTQAESAAIFWNETASWGTVYISPYQNTIAWRFGTTAVGNRQIYSRPVPIGNSFSLTLTMKNENVDAMYINGELAAQYEDKKIDIDGIQDFGQLGRGYNDNTYYPGMIAEVLVYTRALSDTERQTLETYLINKYLLVTSVSEWMVIDK